MGKYFLAFTILLLITACDLLEDNDPCDATVLNPAKVIEIKGIVTATDSDFGNNQNIIPVKIRFYKVLCGENDPKTGSTFTYSGNLERPNFLTFESGTVGYNLRNSDDQIVAELLSDYDLDGIYDYIKSQKYFDAAHLSNTKINIVNFDY